MLRERILKEIERLKKEGIKEIWLRDFVRKIVEKYKVRKESVYQVIALLNTQGVIRVEGRIKGKRLILS